MLGRKRVKCPYCAELIMAEAVKCRHCGETLPVATNANGATSADIHEEPLVGAPDTSVLHTI